MKRRAKKSAARARTFEQVRVANLADPFHAARIARLSSGERFDDLTAKSDDSFAQEIIVHPDCEGGSHRMVDWGDRDGDCYVTTFDGQWQNRGRETTSTHSKPAAPRSSESFGRSMPLTMRLTGLASPVDQGQVTRFIAASGLSAASIKSAGCPQK